MTLQMCVYVYLLMQTYCFGLQKKCLCKVHVEDTSLQAQSFGVIFAEFKFLNAYLTDMQVAET